ncbi:phage major capsid protein [Streptomyces sp. NPDC002144]
MAVDSLELMRLKERRQELRSQRVSLVNGYERRGPESLHPSDDASLDRIARELADVRSQISALENAPNVTPARRSAGAGMERRSASAPQPSGWSVSHEPRTYEQGNGSSYMQDLMRSTIGMDSDGSARRRLQRHAQDVQEAVERRDLSRTDGAGGYFTPPLWVMSQYVELARAGRAYANLCSMQPLPPGTDSINIPKVLTGTATAVQTADNGAVAETDMTDTYVQAPVRTIAGQQDVAVQLIDQSPVSFDQVIFRDLIADHATKTDLQVISGSGSSGQVTGIRATSGITTIAYTTGSPTVAGLYSKLADAVQRVHTNRFMPPTAIVMHPRRWAWFLAASDSTGRPLVVPNAGNPQNAVATLGTVGSEQVVGQMHGLPVVTDPNLPTTLGAGTNEDVIHVVRASDLLLYESGIRSRVLPDVGSGTLTVRLQVFAYLAFTAARYPASVIELGSTGLAAPSF